MLRRIILAVAFPIMIWGLLVFALPGVVAHMPSWCAYWGVVDGVCGDPARDRLYSINEWVKEYLQPFAKSEQYDQLLARANTSLSIVREGVESQDKNGTVKAAMSHIDRSLLTINEQIEDQELAHKIQDVPENASEMLANAVEAAERLKSVLEETNQKAENVRNATQNMQNALDALSGALAPFSRSGGTQSPE